MESGFRIGDESAAGGEVLGNHFERRERVLFQGPVQDGEGFVVFGQLPQLFAVFVRCRKIVDVPQCLFGPVEQDDTRLIGLPVDPAGDQFVVERVGGIVGHKLWNLGRQHQVLCVTHLPQVAAQANHQWQVSKETHGGKTLSSIRALNGEERIEEVARMLGGAKITDTTRKHAREMLGL